MTSFVRLPALGADEYTGPRLPPNAASSVERVTALWCDLLSWQARFEIVDDLLPAARTASDSRPARGAIIILCTALLEQLGETSIRTIEAAVLYALSLHADWRDAGRRYLRAVAATTLDAWMDAHPEVVAFGAAAAGLYAADFTP